MQLYRRTISSYCNQQTYQRGILLWEKSKVSSFHVDETDSEATIQATVRGTAASDYQVQIHLTEGSDDSWDIEEADCDCPAFANYYSTLCKHCVAVCIQFSERQKILSRMEKAYSLSAPIHISSQKLSGVWEHYGADASLSREDMPAPGSLHLFLEFQVLNLYSNYGTVFYPGISVRARAGGTKMYVVQNLFRFLFSVLHQTSYPYGSKREVVHSLSLFDPIAQQMILTLFATARRQTPFLDLADQQANLPVSAKELPLNSSEAERLMSLEYQQSGSVSISGTACRIVDGNPPLTMKLTPEKSTGLMLHCPILQCICPEPIGLYRLKDCIYRTTPDFQMTALPFLHNIGAISVYKLAPIFLAEQDYRRFCACVLPHLRKYFRIDDSQVDLSNYMPVTPEFRFLFSAAKDNAICLHAEVNYGANVYSLESQSDDYRDYAAEAPAVRLIRQYFSTTQPNGDRIASGDEELYALLQDGMEQFRQLGEVLIDTSLQSFHWVSTPQTGVRITLDGGLIDIHVETEGYSVKEINNILQAYRLKKKYIRLKNGEFLSLTESGLSVVATLSDGLNTCLDKDGHMQTNAFRAQYVNQLMTRESTGLSVHRSTNFKQQIRALSNYRDSDYEIPDGLQANLRSYQRTGFRWLCTLSDLGLGGILADDMGLGKTIQMLSYFLHGDGRVLVVCPASLLYNWESECKRFTPTITPYILRGTPAQRRALLQQDKGIFITSYEQLRRDLSFYQDQHFTCCVLDEAQYIRNAATKSAKAVKQLNADHRFALTGTPIENRLSDLWSIFDFLMPGYLYTYPDFKRRFEQPILAGDNQATDQLHRFVAPFLLRRKKQDVLSELPDKVEKVLCVDMTPEQRTLYDAQADALRHTLQNTSDSEFLHQKLTYLSALTRLRQICCTPALYLADYAGGSGKITACMELLQESAESGHRTLVFSQFTSMLDMLGQACETANLPYLYLSGKNTSEQRRDMVDTFQQGNTPVFLISLKAGGTGLNLTAADRVIHFDPWWNAAAEDQATDRTHRIGQKNTVFVTKLVCKDTVEERILTLQEHKRALSDMTMDSSQMAQGTLDRNELLALLSDCNA